MEISERIKRRRQALGMKAEDLAEKIGVARSTIFRYEKGEIEGASLETLVQIADALRCTPTYLMGLEEAGVSERTDEVKRMTMGEIIKSLREEKGLSQQELGDVIGIQKAAVHKYESGMVHNMKRANIKKLADYFGVSPSYLMGWEEAEELEKLPVPVEDVRIPILGTVPAGVPVTAVEDVIGYTYIEQRLAKTGDFFGLIIKGASMEPQLLDGDIVIIRQQPSADTGDIVVALVEDEESTIKKLRRTEEGILLVPNNPDFDPLFFSNKQVRSLPVRIVGVVMQMKREFGKEDDE